MYEYIAHGDVSDFLKGNQEVSIIKSIILQVACITMQLASIYKIYHGDINSGNILIDITNEKYKLENLNVVISGVTPFEESNTKMNLVNYKGIKGKVFFFIGYLNLLLKNPSLLKSTKAIKNQMEEDIY